MTLLLSLVVAAGAPAAGPADPPRKKLIQDGWDLPDTAYLRRHHARMEQEGPFDGVVFKAVVTHDGKRIDTRRVWGADPWPRQTLRPAVDDLEACRWAKFTDNFLRVETGPGDVGWFDDAGWAAVAEKFGHLAWAAKRGGARGFQFDPEHYDGKPFAFAPRPGGSFAAACDKARQRGRQVMTAVAAEYPDLVFLSLWLTSRSYPPDVTGDYRKVLAADDEYGLFPAFFNGLLDAAPPGVRFVDGNETAFYAKSELDYLRMYTWYRQASGHGGAFVAPENKAKFGRQATVASCLYLDMHLNEPGNRLWAGAGDRYVRPSPAGEARVRTLERFLGYAVSASDEYVWAWGEQGRWWSAQDLTRIRPDVATSVGKGRRWEEALPGITAAFERVRRRVATPPPFFPHSEPPTR